MEVISSSKQDVVERHHLPFDDKISTYIVNPHPVRRFVNDLLEEVKTHLQGAFIRMPAIVYAYD